MNLADLRRGGHAPSLFAAFLHFDISFMVWVILGALLPFIVADIPMSAAAKMSLAGTPLLAAGAWRLLLGALADRYGSKRVGVASLAVTLVPLLLGWRFAQDRPALIVVGLLLGVAGASFAVSLPLASRWYPPHLQGLAMGIAGAGNSGTVLATLFAPMLAKAYGWHAVFGLMMVPVALTLVAFAVLAKDPPRPLPERPLPRSLRLASPSPKGKGAPEGNTRLALVALGTSPPFPLGEGEASLSERGRGYPALLRTPDAWWLCLLYFVTFGGFVGLSSFFNTFFVDQYGIPKASVGLWTWPFLLAGSFLRPVGGALSDRLGGVRMLTLLYAVVAGCAVLVGVLIGHFWATAAVLFVLMGCLGMGNGSVFQLVPQRFRREIGAMTGLVGAAGGVGGYYLSFALGQLKDLTGTYAAGFWAFAAIAAVALVVLRTVAAGWTRTWLGAGGVAAADPAGGVAPALQARVAATNAAAEA